MKITHLILLLLSSALSFGGSFTCKGSVNGDGDHDHGQELSHAEAPGHRPGMRRPASGRRGKTPSGVSTPPTGP